MKIFSFLFLILFNFVAFSTSIGIVDVQKAFGNIHEAQKYLREMAEEEEKILQDEESAKKTLQQDMVKLQQEATKLSAEARARKEDEFRNRIASLEEKSNKVRQSFMEKKAKIQGEVENKIKLRSESIARKRKYDLVINTPALLYVSDEMKKSHDITDDLVREYNKDYPVKAAAPSAKQPAKKK